MYLMFPRHPSVSFLRVSRVSLVCPGVFLPVRTRALFRRILFRRDYDHSLQFPSSVSVQIPCSVPSAVSNHVCQRASGHNRCHRSRGRQLLYAIASWFLSLLCRVRHRVLTSAPPRSGFISSMTSERQVLARAQSERYAPPKPKLVRRHSTGDHVFLPDQKHKAAINAAKKNFGVPPVTVQDREVFSILALLTMPV